MAGPLGLQVAQTFSGATSDGRLGSVHRFDECQDLVGELVLEVDDVLESLLLRLD